MKKTFTFKSIARPTWRYRLHESDGDNPAYHWQRAQYAISSYLSQYDTMGDREVQHSPDCLVNVEDVVDVIESLACSLHEIQINLNDDEECQMKAVKWFWRCEPSASDNLIRFLLTLKWNEKKDTYYTFEDGGAKSHADSKRHDKRWMKIERPYDDDVSDISRVMKYLCADGSNSKPYQIIQHIATVMRISQLANPDGYWTHAAICDLKKGGSVFSKLSNGKVGEMLNDFQRITTFKEGVWHVRWSINASKRAQDNYREERERREAAESAEKTAEPEELAVVES